MSADEEDCASFFKKLICIHIELWVTQKWSYLFILSWCYSKRINKTISILSVLGSTVGALNKWVIRLDLDEVVYIMSEKFGLCVYVATVIHNSHVSHIAGMMEYWLRQQEDCAVAPGMMQNTVEFHFPVGSCIPRTASS